MGINGKISDHVLFQGLYRAGVRFMTGVPDSGLGAVTTGWRGDEGNLEFTISTSEGESIGIAAGAWIAGRYPAVFMQNSGLGNAVNPLTSLSLVYKAPILLMISWRGAPGTSDAPQHRIMGPMTAPLLDLMNIPNEEIDPLQWESQVSRVVRAGIRDCRPTAILVRKGVVHSEASFESSLTGNGLNRDDVLKCLLSRLPNDYGVISTTGALSRAVWKVKPDDGKVYFPMQGSMGCAPAIAYGALAANPRFRIAVIDGDGALLMKMGTLATIADAAPPHLLHICLDNQCYESTGGQPTASRSVRLEQVASACGYKTSRRLNDFETLKNHVDRILHEAGAHFILIPTIPCPGDLPSRPEAAPDNLLTAFRKAFGTRR